MLKYTLVFTHRKPRKQSASSLCTQCAWLSDASVHSVQFLWVGAALFNLRPHDTDGQVAMLLGKLKFVLLWEWVSGHNYLWLESLTL